jgi:rod shape-determining protein MreD
MRSRFDFFYYFRRIILPELLYTILVTLFLYRAIYMIDQKLEPKRDLKERIDIV